MFGRAAIRLGIGPHSSFDYFDYFASRKCVVISAVSSYCSSCPRNERMYGSLFMVAHRQSSAVCQMCLRYRGRSSRAHARASSVCRLPWRLQAAPSDYCRPMMRRVQQLPHEYSC